MQKLRFLFLLLLFPSLLFAQSRIELVKSSAVKVDAKTNITYAKNPTFKHDNATLTCDSAVFYTELNYFEAYKNVHINQADTINIFSDLLNYDGNKKIAHLLNNVRLVDPTSVLTTNILDYNMVTKTGTYIDGGKIVTNKQQVTLTSKKGWYFAGTNDAYFRYNVDVVTPQVNIKSDTLVYNTASNWAFFHGPTDIKGKDDKLYTENGAYNTKDENAYFGKKNLYTQGSKTLRGDSLYYYGKRGYGKAVKNIVFQDSEDKLLLKGQLGEYYKLDQRAVVTKNAYVGLATADSITVDGKKIPDTLWLGADTLEAQMVLQKTLKLISAPVVLKNNEIGAETEKEKKERELAKSRVSTPSATKAPEQPVIKSPEAKTDKKTDKKSKNKEDLNPVPKPPDSLQLKLGLLKTDSIRKDSTQKDSLLQLVKKPVVKDSLKTLVKAGEKLVPQVKNVIPKDTPKTGIILPGNLKTVAKKDTVPFNPADTVRTRTIKAYHDVRVFKANLQAKSDSLFYSAADSTLRWYKDPMIWAENSQQTGDTIYVQFRNKKINSLQVIANGFMANTTSDSTKFNQVKGKVMTGFFKDGELKTMYVDGNAESIYFTKDKDGDQMNQTVSGRIRFSFVDKEIDNIMNVKENEGINATNEDIPKETHLTGFIWKPELRPVSKADIIKGRPGKKEEKPKAAPKPKTTPAKTPVKGSAAAKESTPTKKPVVNTKTLNQNEKEPIKLATEKKKLDSVKTDTTKKPIQKVN